MGFQELIESIIMAGAGALVVGGIGYVSSLWPNSEGREDSDGGSFGATRGAGAAGFGIGGGDFDSEQTDDIANKRQIEVLIGTAQMLAQNGHLEEAVEQYRAALQVVLDAIAPTEKVEDQPIMAALINVELGQLYRSLDKLPEADKALANALAVFRKRESEEMDEENKAAAEVNICKLMSSLAEVKSMRTRLINQKPETDEEDATFATLSSTRSDETMKMLDEAKALAKESLERMEKLYGAEPRTVKERIALAGSLRSLTQVLMFTKDFIAAETTIRRSISLLERTVAPMDASIVTMRMWLCQVLLAQEKFDDAANVNKDLIATHRGEADEINFTRSLGETYFDAGRTAEAERAFRESIELAHNFHSSDVEDQEIVRASEWQATNSLVSVYLELGRKDLAKQFVSKLKTELPVHIDVLTTSRNLRTIEAMVTPMESNGTPMYAYLINVLVRDRRSQNLPSHCWLRFKFQNPESEDEEPVYMNLEKQLEDDTRTVALSSPALRGFRNGSMYTISVEVLAPDHKTLLTEHIQLVRAVMPNGLVL